MAWISVVMAILGLVMTVGQWFTTYANISSALEFQKAELTRNFNEDRDHRSVMHRSIERLDAANVAMSRVNIDIEVLKTHLNTISETLKRLEVDFRDKGRPRS